MQIHSSTFIVAYTQRCLALCAPNDQIIVTVYLALVMIIQELLLEKNLHYFITANMLNYPCQIH